MVLVIYLVLAALVGLLGTNRAIGFWGFFILSLYLTPFVGFLMIMVSRPRKGFRPQDYA